MFSLPLTCFPVDTSEDGVTDLEVVKVAPTFREIGQTLISACPVVV